MGVHLSQVDTKSHSLNSQEFPLLSHRQGEKNFHSSFCGECKQEMFKCSYIEEDNNIPCNPTVL